MQTGQNSAKIYQFPAGGRASVAADRTDARHAELRAPDMPVVDFGSGWYHGAAIEETVAHNRPTAEVRPFSRH